MLDWLHSIVEMAQLTVLDCVFNPRSVPRMFHCWKVEDNSNGITLSRFGHLET